MSGGNSLLIATPTDGNPNVASVSYAYHTGVRQLERSGAVVLPAELCFSDDLARARSRCVWHALQRDGWDAILWWDDDVAVPDTQIVPRMLERMQQDGHDVLGAPYPRKRIQAQFPYKPLDSALQSGRIDVVNDCVEVELLAIGFMLTTRKCLEAMATHYVSEEWFSDGHGGEGLREVVALFRQVMTPEITLPNGQRFRELYSEDYSFCYRWRAMGGKVQMYVGPGSPLGHIGPHMFVGDRTEIGRVM